MHSRTMAFNSVPGCSTLGISSASRAVSLRFQLLYLDREVCMVSGLVLGQWETLDVQDISLLRTACGRILTMIATQASHLISLKPMV